MDATKTFTTFANSVSKYAGRPVTFLLCILMVVVWAACGPLAGFSETWQLIINTSTTIITFLMVFLIQNTQNRDNAAIQAKLDELIRVGDGQNGFIGIERLTDKELEDILASFDSDELLPSVKKEIIEKTADKVRSKGEAKAKGQATSKTTEAHATKAAAKVTGKKPAAKRAPSKKK